MLLFAEANHKLNRPVHLNCRENFSVSIQSLLQEWQLVNTLSIFTKYFKVGKLTRSYNCKLKMTPNISSLRGYKYFPIPSVLNTFDSVILNIHCFRVSSPWLSSEALLLKLIPIWQKKILMESSLRLMKMVQEPWTLMNSVKWWCQQQKRSKSFHSSNQSKMIRIIKLLMFNISTKNIWGSLLNSCSNDKLPSLYVNRIFWDSLKTLLSYILRKIHLPCFCCMFCKYVVILYFSNKLFLWNLCILHIYLYINSEEN